MMALIIQIDREERPLSGAGIDGLELGSPRMYPLRVVSVSWWLRRGTKAMMRQV